MCTIPLQVELLVFYFVMKLTRPLIESCHLMAHKIPCPGPLYTKCFMYYVVIATIYHIQYKLILYLQCIMIYGYLFQTFPTHNLCIKNPNIPNAILSYKHYNGKATTSHTINFHTENWINHTSNLKMQCFIKKIIKWT